MGNPHGLRTVAIDLLVRPLLPLNIESPYKRKQRAGFQTNLNRLFEKIVNLINIPPKGWTSFPMEPDLTGISSVKRAQSGLIWDEKRWGLPEFNKRGIISDFCPLCIRTHLDLFYLIKSAITFVTGEGHDAPLQVFAVLAQ